MTNRSVLWISGWSFPAPVLADMAREAMPALRHEAIDAGPEAIASAKASSTDLLGGFSFGAHLLLGINDPRPRILLAPFVDLKRETGLGGAVATTQIRQQLRQVRRDPLAAVTEFRKRIGSRPPEPGEIVDMQLLVWGLERMLEVSPVPAPLPDGSIAIAGRSDPLLDTPRLAEILPSLRVSDAGHQLEPLLAAAAASLHDAR